MALVRKACGRRAKSARKIAAESSSLRSDSKGRPASSRLPVMRGRRSIWNSASRNCHSRKDRRSSITRISSSPSAKARAASASKGQARPTFQIRKPWARAKSSEMPASANAWRKTVKALPRTAMPKRASALSNTMRSMPLVRANALARGSFTWRRRSSCNMGVSVARICTPSGGVAMP